MIHLTEKALEVARIKVEETPFNLRASYTNVAALKAILAEKERSALANFGQHPRPNPLDIGNSSGHPFNAASCLMPDYNIIKTAMALLESTDEYREALALIQPRVDDVRRLEAQLDAEVQAVSVAAHARQEKIDAAKAVAIAEIEARFATPEPASALEPASLIRGRQKLAVEALAAD